MPVKPSTNAIYYYLGTAPGETLASLQARSGKSWFELLAPSPCPSCLWVSLSLSQPQFPRQYYGGNERSRDWECQLYGASKPGRLCSTAGGEGGAGSETGIRVRRNAPLPLPLAEKAQSKDVGQTDFRWNPDLLLLHVLRGQRVKVLEAQRQGFVGEWRGHWGRSLGTAQEPGPAAPARGLALPALGAPTHPEPSSPAGSALTPAHPRCDSRPLDYAFRAAACGRDFGAFGLHRLSFPFPFFPAPKKASFLSSRSQRSLTSGQRKGCISQGRRPFWGRVFGRET